MQVLLVAAETVTESRAPARTGAPQSGELGNVTKILTAMARIALDIGVHGRRPPLVVER